MLISVFFTHSAWLSATCAFSCLASLESPPRSLWQHTMTPGTFSAWHILARSRITLRVAPLSWNSIPTGIFLAYLMGTSTFALHFSTSYATFPRRSISWILARRPTSSTYCCLNALDFRLASSASALRALSNSATSSATCLAEWSAASFAARSAFWVARNWASSSAAAAFLSSSRACSALRRASSLATSSLAEPSSRQSISTSRSFLSEAPANSLSLSPLQ
mmetsp:Transcript_14119/g.40143  ORF Transcript_14119/g.40143 Transcript_14119/m.40143 type:complete len:221 (+) Transcript_14119:219-881(+)